jgi:hypothetical protein
MKHTEAYLRRYDIHKMSGICNTFKIATYKPKIKEISKNEQQQISHKAYQRGTGAMANFLTDK